MSSNQIRSDIKLIIIGDVGTGKTSLVNRWTKNIFNEAYKATIVSEFGFKIVEEQGQLYRIQLWDIGGMDQNAMVTKIFAKDAQGCVIVCDATKKKTRDDTIKWKESIEKNIDLEKIPIILIENKCDLLGDDESKYNKDLEQLNIFGENYNISKCYRTSAMNGFNVEESITFLVNEIIDIRGDNLMNKRNDNVMLKKEIHKKEIKKQKKKKCC